MSKNIYFLQVLSGAGRALDRADLTWDSPYAADCIARYIMVRSPIDWRDALDHAVELVERHTTARPVSVESKPIEDFETWALRRARNRSR
tara:strand:+ start:158 stop:427 length:270 start_codon:yes stop_codon:yes gene_type:complete